MMYRKPAKFLSWSDGKVWKNSGNHSRGISCYLYDLGDSISFCYSCGMSFLEPEICTLMDDILLCWFGDSISPFLFREIIRSITYIFYATRTTERIRVIDAPDKTISQRSSTKNPSRKSKREDRSKRAIPQKN